MASELNGKVALVTGGTSGIGRATAVALARAGANVVVSGRREPEGEQTVRAIRDAGGDGLFVRGDIALEADVAAMVERSVGRFGRLDIAFNNAGVEVVGPITQASVEDYRRVFDVNVLGVVLSMKHQIPAMLKAGGGVIINNASIAGVVGMGGVPLYVASKHAVLGLTRSVALEYAKQGIRVNAVSPAAIETEMWDRFTGGDAGMQGAMAGMHPIGRVGRSEEVASAVVYLCTPGASFITGTNLMVDGGWTAQ